MCAGVVAWPRILPKATDGGVYELWQRAPPLNSNHLEGDSPLTVSAASGTLVTSLGDRRAGQVAGDFGLTRDHDLRRLDDGQRIVATAQLQIVNGIARDDRSEQLITDSQPHLPQEPVDA